jgi:hypothetical protein
MKVRKQFVKRACESWRSLNEVLSEFTEDEVIFAMELENERETVRSTILKRLSQRLAGIRIAELKKELADGEETGSD